MSHTGTCETCGDSFSYDLFHTGFGDSAYAYCGRCGCTALISDYLPRPPGVPITFHQCITKEVEPYLTDCPCGGRFHAGAAPRCPSCDALLSADAAAAYIEANAPGTATGWTWQRDWVGVYCIVIDGKLARDPWRPELMRPP